MSLMKELITESAAGGATTAGGIAGFRGAIGGMNRRQRNKKRGVEQKVRHTLKPVGTFYALKLVETEQTFDPADVIAKMSAAENKAKDGQDTKTFALEDEDGNIVKVSVAADEADDFEDALSRSLHGDGDGSVTDGEGEIEGSALEIAEILFKLKDRFTIVDVAWPQVEEDQEEDATEANAETMGDMEGGEEGGDALADDGEEGMGDEEGLEGEDGMDAEGGEEYDQMSALSQVIDLLKSQQDAQRAEADAKTAEANAKRAEAERDEAMAKVRQEEQILDMETYYKKEKEGDKEAKRLAQLARWKHDMAADNEAEPQMSVSKSEVSVEQEEDDAGTVDIYRRKVDANEDGKLDPKEFIRYLFKHLRD